MTLGNYSQDDTEYRLGISDYNFSTVFFVLKNLTNNVSWDPVLVAPGSFEPSSMGYFCFVVVV